MASVHTSPTTETLSVALRHYCFVSSEQQPSLDPSAQVHHLVFSSTASARYSRLVKRFQWWLVPLYLVVLLLRTLVVFVDAPLGRKLAPMAFILQLPLIAVFVLSLSHEFAHLLACMLDFWLHSLTSGVWIVCLAITFNDSRMLILLGCWVDCMNAVLVEANLHAGIASIAVAAVAASVLMALMAAVSLDLIQDVKYEVHVTPRHSVVSIKDLMLNAMGTTFMLLIRVLYRKHMALKQERSSDTPGLHQSLSYRCRLMLQLQCASLNAVEPTEVNLQEATRTSATRQPRLNMRFVKYPTTIDPRKVLVPAIAQMTMDMKTWHAHMLYAVGVVSLVMSSLSFILSVTLWIPIVALGAALAYVGWFICCLHQELLYQLFTSFDFVFLYLQLLAAHVCICELINWDWMRSCAVVSGHLWMFWALTLDALTPGLRRRLRLNMAMAMWIVFICAFAKALLSVELLCWSHWQIQDSELFDVRIMRRPLKFRVQSFLLSRFLTILAWCSRLLWRLCTRRDENELVMLLGRVEYNYRDWKTQNWNWALSSMKAVGPEPPNSVNDG